MSDYEYTAKDLQRSLELHERDRERLLQELSEALSSRDYWRDIAYSFARAEANQHDGNVEQVIRDEHNWLESQNKMRNLGVLDENDFDGYRPVFLLEDDDE